MGARVQAAVAAQDFETATQLATGREELKQARRRCRWLLLLLLFGVVVVVVVVVVGGVVVVVIVAR